MIDKIVNVNKHLLITNSPNLYWQTYGVSPLQENRQCFSHIDVKIPRYMYIIYGTFTLKVGISYMLLDTTELDTKQTVDGNCV